MAVLRSRPFLFRAGREVSLIIPDKNIDVREIILVMTYSVVVFSILIQGSTITKMIEKAKKLEK